MHRLNSQSMLNVITSITVVGKEIRVGVNNAMVLSNDLTSTERKLKLVLFSIVSTCTFTTCGICS